MITLRALENACARAAAPCEMECYQSSLRENLASFFVLNVYQLFDAKYCALTQGD